jgi:hypothetical protein
MSVRLATQLGLVEVDEEEGVGGVHVGLLRRSAARFDHGPIVADGPAR